MNDRERWDLVCAHAEALGYHVELEPHDQGGELHPHNRAIYVDSAQRPRARLYTLLHELGHALQTEEPASPVFAGAWAELDRELDAWARGWRLAERLALGISLRGYRRVAAACLLTYTRELPGA